MLHTVTQLIIGFSVVSGLILLFAYLFFLSNMQKTRLGIMSCSVLLLALVGLQLAHLYYLQTGADLFSSPGYVLLLLAAPPAFYFFGREILLPDSKTSLREAWHLLPLLSAAVLPADYIAPIAFIIGTGYSIWLARIVYGMRRQVARFRFEMFFFGLFALLAVGVLTLVFLVPYTSAEMFYVGYAIAIGTTLILIVGALIVFPELLSDISDAAAVTYASSTLGGVDIEAALRELDRRMTDEKVFQNENLNLGMLADMLQLTSHQLSELINTQFGISFPRYVREKRVAEASRLLQEEGASSILSISMAVGFRSQSNFYAAFREITGESPGKFRNQ